MSSLNSSLDAERDANRFSGNAFVAPTAVGGCSICSLVIAPGLCRLDCRATARRLHSRRQSPAHDLGKVHSISATANATTVAAAQLLTPLKKALTDQVQSSPRLWDVEDPRR